MAFRVGRYFGAHSAPKTQRLGCGATARWQSLRIIGDGITAELMLSLSDAQLKAVMIAASGLQPEKRELFLERLAA